jgi:hypothetical protein
VITVIREVILATGTSLTALIIVKITVTWALSLSAAWLARRSRAALRHALLTVAFGVTLILPIASILAPPVHIAVPLVTASRTASHPLVRTIDATRSVTPVNAGVRLMPTIPEACSRSLSALLIAGWIVGTALALLPMAMGLRLIHSMRQSGLRWPHGQAVVKRLAAEAGIHRRVEVLLYEDLQGPMTCGIVHP